MASLAVVVGVIYNSSGEVLLAKRAEHQHQGGLWEFPGGKLESNELPIAGLWRELNEELGINIINAKPIIQIEHQYPDLSVFLDVFAVTEFEGAPQGKLGQPLLWVSPKDLDKLQFPAANLPIMRAVQLPPVITISGAAETPELWLERLESCLLLGNRLLLLRQFDERQKQWPWAELIQQAFALCRMNGAACILHSNLLPMISDPSRLQGFLETLPAQCRGLHLSTRVAADWQHSLPNRLLVGMSCHNAQELARAESLGCNYAFISPVLMSESHPGVSGLGWSDFAGLCRQAKIPIYALGGLSPEHQNMARNLGGQGVSGIRGFWVG